MIERKMNYKGENYLPTGKALLDRLEHLSKELLVRMSTPGLRHKVSDILRVKTNTFKIHWPNEIPLNPNHRHSRNEYKGLYAFARITQKGIDWQYIGISQTIKRRFKGHTVRKTKNHSSWAYLMSKSQAAIPKTQRELIDPCYFTFVQIEDHMLLHLAEVYCVNRFQAKWNSFETH